MDLIPLSSEQPSIVAESSRVFRIPPGEPKPRLDPMATAIRMVTRVRLAGWLFLLASPLLIRRVATLFAPQVTVSINGEPTNDLTIKLAFAGFLLMYPLLGGFLVFTPRRILERWGAAFIRWTQRRVRNPRWWP